jgi:hypothetical protein
MLEKFKALLPHKLRVFSIHFMISLVIFAVLLYLILFHWYPLPWFSIDGGWQGVRIMIGVDLVLGPLLTFIIFNPAKGRRELTFDFSLIALVQLSAMIWGIYLVHGQRPLAIVHWFGAFHSVDSKSPGFKYYPIEKLDAFGEHRPVIVFQQDPETEDEKLDMVMAIFGNDQGEYEHPELYRPLAPNLDEVFAKQVDIKALTQQSPDAVQRLLRKHPGTKPEDLRYVAFDGRYEQATLVFEPDGTLIGSLPPLAPPPAPTPLPKTAPQPAQGKG